MSGMWLMVFWVAFLSSTHCRPQSFQLDDTSSNVELVPILYGGVIPYWITRNQLQPLSNPHLHLYRLIPENGGGIIQRHTDSPAFPKKTSVEMKEVPLKHETSNTKTNPPSNENLMETTRKTPVTPMNPINRMISDLTMDSLRSMTSSSSLAPYRFHPLLNFLKQRINLGNTKIIEVRNDKSEVPAATTTLILKPVARSVAGVDGKAISNPVSRAALRKGVNADILFEPDAVAIAGPGGIAHAESSLEIFYEEDLEEKS